MREKWKPRICPIAGRKIRQGKQRSEIAPQQDRRYPGGPPILHRQILDHGKTAVQYGSCQRPAGIANPHVQGWMDSHVYSRSNTRTSLGLLWPTMRTVIVKVLRSVESSICRVSVILPWNLKRGKPRFRGWFLADRPRISLFHSQRLHWINPRRPPCRNKAGQGRHN